VRVAHARGPAADPSAFRSLAAARRALGGEEVTRIVQYWLFYLYDCWIADTPLGRLVQEHEADWEAITIGLSDDRPLFVAYSSHCGGEWLPWRDAPVEAREPRGPGSSDWEARPLENDVASGRWYPNEEAAGRELLRAMNHERTHPAVMVAEGSQAMYPAGHDRRAPNWVKCSVLDKDLGDVVSFAGNLREHVALDRKGDLDRAGSRHRYDLADELPRLLGRAQPDDVADGRRPADPGRRSRGASRAGDAAVPVAVERPAEDDLCR
jgi:hypothetical protein